MSLDSNAAGQIRIDSSAASTPGGAVTALGLGRAAFSAARTWLYLLAALLALFAVAAFCVSWFQNGSFGFDFQGTLWEPARKILAGDNPYPPPTRAAIQVGNPAIYPPLLMVFVAPFSWLPWSVAVALWVAISAGGVVLALYILGVRDLRCYALALISFPVAHGLILGNATLVFVPLVALAWRWRDKWARCGAAIGLGIACKLFVWPLILWLLGTRRYRAAATAVAAAGAGVLLPWALIGFDGFMSYPDVLSEAQRVYSTHSYSVATSLAAVGVGADLAARATLAIGLVVGITAFVAGRRGSDSASVSLAVLAAVLASPIVWPVYYALLLVPVAIARPRFSPLWVMLPLFSLAQLMPRPRITTADISPGGFACCPPDGVPDAVWAFSHGPPGLWPALANVAVAAGVVVVVSWMRLSETDVAPVGEGT